jgi:catechol 2,3-dioxygenase
MDMSVLGVIGVAMEVPDLEPAKRFYEDAGLRLEERDGRLRCRCEGQQRDAITLVGGAERKRFHHLILAVDPDSMPRMMKAIANNGGEMVGTPPGWSDDGLWLRDPHGMLIHLVDGPGEIDLAPVEPFTINQPGHTVRANLSAMQPKAGVGAILPLRLGHVLLFTPDVMVSIDFFEKALGMGLADRAQDIVAFMCSRHGSDHHVVAFAKSEGIGFHHASFQVATPDQVGVGGDRLAKKSGRGDWGFGRHTIGSNFFHYIQDPWGSWFEYYCDIDYVADYDAWTPTVYGMEDSLHHWGPEVPEDFVHNYELDAEGYSKKEKIIPLDAVG